MKMSRTGALSRIGLTVAGVAAIALSGCLADFKGNNNVGNNTFNETGTLQGTIFDATTGVRISDSSLKVTLVQGTSYRSPSTLKKGSDVNAGDYAFNGIPVSLDGNIQYRIIVTADNYQRFEGYVWTDISWSCCQESNNTFDSTYNWIGNIYVFPMGDSAPDMTFRVLHNEVAVAGATVHLTQNTNWSETTTDYGPGGVGYRIYPANGLQPHLTAQTDANGDVVFAGSSLVLGGNYGVVVDPATLPDGTKLERHYWGNFNEGNQQTMNYVWVDSLTPYPWNQGLYIVSNSNYNTSNLTSTGVLTITFNRPVALVEEPLINATLFSANTAALDTSSLGSDVVASMSADGLVLTLTPVFSSPIIPWNGGGASNNGPSGTNLADIGTWIRYSNVQVVLTDGANGNWVFDVFNDLADADWNNINNSVQITANIGY